MKDLRFEHRESIFKQLRTKSNYSIEHLRSELEKYGLFYSSAAIYKWDKGLRFPDQETIVALSKIFKVPIEIFFKKVNKNPKRLTNKVFNLADRLCDEIRRSDSFYRMCLSMYVEYLRDNS